MKKIVAAVAAAGVAITGVVLLAPSGASAAPSAPGQYAPPAIAWGACADESLKKAGAECGMLDVPLDYAKLDGEKIQIAVSRVKHKVPDAQSQGPILVNPGGPGGSGLIYATLGANVPNKVGEAFDWIGFDPRGVGSSKPALSCDPNYFTYNRPEYVPVHPNIERVNLEKAKGYAEACGKAGGKLLDHVKTTDTINDMESIRKALGVEQINYYGFSYGTYLGQVYGTLHPERMRRVVMDGVVNHKDVWYKANLNQDIAFDRNIKIYFEWISRYDNVFRLGKTGHEVERQYYAQRDKLGKKPAGGVIGSSEFNDLFLPAAYGQRRWEDIAKAFSGWVHRGEWEPLKARYDAANGPGDDNGFAMYNGTQCTDVQWPEWKQQRFDNWTTHFRAPFQTWANAWYNAPCLNWAAKASKPVSVDGAKAPPVLLISEELDAATPYPGALQARQSFPKSSLISLPGGTVHSGSLGGNACVDDRIAEYLATGKLPERKPGNASDVQCTPKPQPVPKGANVATREHGTVGLDSRATLLGQLLGRR
ncbi:alpha/beta hydrolase family protein [Herbihabitans rhizosphaerae]|uniref:Alpha/beta hydrolase family protein n=1 Tax=Herbihabitans rhizosphaerae TaxID=1872711 RepID=A0A4Q7KB93_9PSEU|nr:alpha/beta hydrolase [Herbihabitans rhizosphaerae]RZS29767.1 alpha/beta hydrolase family protein [Herbihabitans rhizosphaerae]